MPAHVGPAVTLYVVQIQSAAGTVTSCNLTLKQAAERLGIDPHELEWSIEEFGICSTLDDGGKEIVAVAVGDEWRLS